MKPVGSKERAVSEAEGTWGAGVRVWLTIVVWARNEDAVARVCNARHEEVDHAPAARARNDVLRLHWRCSVEVVGEEALERREQAKASAERSAVLPEPPSNVGQPLRLDQARAGLAPRALRVCLR